MGAGFVNCVLLRIKHKTKFMKSQFLCIYTETVAMADLEAEFEYI